MPSASAGTRTRRTFAITLQVVARVLVAFLMLSSMMRSAAGQAPAYDAAFVSQTAPATVEILKTAPVSITMRNTGAATWRSLERDVFLATQEPQDNFYWCIQDNRYGGRSGNRVLLPEDVLPGAEVTFTFMVKPLACGFTGPSPLRFRMLSQTHGTFGEETPDPKTGVTTAAEFVSQQVPTTVPAGSPIGVSVTYRNTTPSTLLPEQGYVLVPVNDGATTWGVASVPLPGAVEPNATVTFAFTVTTPQTPGTYNFQWLIDTADHVGFGQISPATPVQVVTPLNPNYQGLWWSSPAGSESGWGISFAHQGTVIFATWFTYDANGNPVWLSATTQQASNGVFSGTLLRSTGPPFNAVPFSPSRVRSTTAGTVSLSFTDGDNGSFAYTMNGVTQTKTITRQVFGQLPTCTFGIITDLTKAYNYQDLWWAAPAGVESGWGVSLAHEGDVIFATWFTYDLDGSALWLSATAPRTDDGSFKGTLYRTTGPPFNSVPFDPALVVATAVGDASFTFSDGNTGVFAYTVNGVSQSKAITRQVFLTPGTVCQ